MNNLPAISSTSISLVDLVGNYDALSGNDDQKRLTNRLIAAKWAWKDIFKTTVWSAVHTPVQVKQGKVNLYDIPKDALRFLGVSYVDECGTIKQLPRDNSWNVIELPQPKKCGDDCLCDAINSFTSTIQDIIIDDKVYEYKVWTKKCHGGKIIEYTETPVKDYAENGTYTVKIVPSEKQVCEVEVDEIGCIKPTEKNKVILVDCCGQCVESSCFKKCQEGYQDEKKFKGRWKEQDGKIHVETNLPVILLSRQTNGECAGEEMMVPEAAATTVFAGIKFFVEAYNPRVSATERDENRRLFRVAKTELSMFLDPFTIEDWRELKNVKIIW